MVGADLGLEFTPARALILILAVLAGCSSGQDGQDESPSGSWPEYRQPRAAFLQLVRACIEEHGFDVVLGEDEGFNFPNLRSEEQQREAREVSRACVAEVDPARLEPVPPLTAQQLGEMYRYALAQAECMRAAGYPVGEAPPERVFIDTDGAWDPYIDLVEQGNAPHPEDVVRCQSVDAKPEFLDR
ncbi:hypothetical protein BH23CHL10_BH23CHL10_13700 [soil metagenome]